MLWGSTVKLCLWLDLIKWGLAVATRSYYNQIVVHYVIKDCHCARVISISYAFVGSCMALFYNVTALWKVWILSKYNLLNNVFGHSRLCAIVKLTIE